MTVPAEAILETEPAGGVALYDVVDLLPPARKKRQRRRNPARIRRLYLHHSGRLGRDGFAGLLASSRYVVYQRKFPGAYPFWVPHRRHTDRQGRLVVYRAEPDDVLSWHTGGQNTVSTAIGLQGNTTTDGLSAFQEECLEAMIPWCMERYGLGLGDLYGHCEAPEPKRACPGREAMEWLREWRGD